MGKILDIVGPFEGKINTIYQFKTENGPDFIFRARTSLAFRYENIIKEKILFPFLDGAIQSNSSHLYEKIREITNKQVGSYILNDSNLPIKIQNLFYYDETRTKLPYMFAIFEFINGESLYYPLEKDRNSNPNMIKSEKYIDIFHQIGEVLGKLHNIKFDGFYSDIRDIGNYRVKKQWIELFNEQFKKEFNEAQKHKNIQPYLPSIEKYLKKNLSAIEYEDNPVLFHNDFQAQNIIIESSEDKFNLKGLIDFDNWRIGPPAQDLVKMQYWTIKDVSELNDAFFNGYLKIQKIYSREQLQQQIDIYKMLWFILVFNFEMDKILKNEKNISVDARFPAAEKYLAEIESILNQNL